MNTILAIHKLKIDMKLTWIKFLRIIIFSMGILLNGILIHAFMNNDSIPIWFMLLFGGGGGFCIWASIFASDKVIDSMSGGIHIDF